jgi:predicted nucleic acid-binding protein
MNLSLVLDTNILVSAALHLDGPPGLLVQAALRREVAFFTCPGILNEYWDVLIIGETQPERVFSTLERPARSVSANVRNKQTRRYGDLAEVRGDKI